jgi:hypothetical protein
VPQNEGVTETDLPDALQDVLLRQPAVMVGLISMMTGSALQDDIVSTVQILVRKGQDILDMKAGIRTDWP